MIDPVALRQLVYEDLVATGRPPTSERIGDRFGVTASDARQALAALRIGKTVLLDPRSGEIWMAGPFAAAKTSYSMRAGNTEWWANCAWDLLGVAAIVGRPARFRAVCTDCRAPFEIDFDPAIGISSDWIVHFLLPARRWYDDIGFT